MLISFSIGTFLTNYDVTCRKLQMSLMHSSVWKRKKRGQNKSLDTTCVKFQDVTHNYKRTVCDETAFDSNLTS